MRQTGSRAAHPAEHHAEGTCRARRRGGRHDQALRKDRRSAVPHRPHHRPGFEAAGGLHRALQDSGRPNLALPPRTEEAPAAREEEMRLNVFLNMEISQKLCKKISRQLGKSEWSAKLQ